MIFAIIFIFVGLHLLNFRCYFFWTF